MNINIELSKRIFHSKLYDSNQNDNAIGDYNITEKNFKFVNRAVKDKLYIKSLSILIQTSSKFNPSCYGNQRDLDDGVVIYHTRKGAKNYIINEEHPIKTNTDWLFYDADIQQIHFGMIGPETFKIKMDFFKSTNTYVVLEHNDEICVELNDNFSNLIQHTFSIDGFYLKK
jgi:hypothetical protein